MQLALSRTIAIRRREPEKDASFIQTQERHLYSPNSYYLGRLEPHDSAFILHELVSLMLRRTVAHHAMKQPSRVLVDESTAYTTNHMTSNTPSTSSPPPAAWFGFLLCVRLPSLRRLVNVPTCQVIRSRRQNLNGQTFCLRLRVDQNHCIFLLSLRSDELRQPAS